MAMRWNWRKLGFGSGALLAALSTAFAYSPNNDGDQEKMKQTANLMASMKAGVLAQSQAATKDKDRMLQEAIEKSRKLCKRVNTEKGLPGLTVGVSVNGKMVWQEGFGFANLEQGVRMKPESVMRIASISKSMTMAMLAKLMEEGKIDIDKPIQTYLPTYPEKYVDGEKVTITTRYLLSHLSGIRHYEKKEHEKRKRNEDNQNDANKTDKDTLTSKDKDNLKPKKKKKQDEMEMDEYFLKKKFASVEDALKLFQDDELLHKPGTKYLYTTHGWTVVSAIIEKLTESEFPKHCKLMFDYWGLKNTTLDLHEPIIYNRTNYYTRHKNGEIINSPYVDNSYKWAGGGILSNVADLTQFANILLYSMQTPEDHSIKTCEKGLPKVPFLKQSTVKSMWTGNPATAVPHSPDNLYALGFVVGEPIRKCMFCKERDLMSVHHSGGAIGASSILLLAFPTNKQSNNCDKPSSEAPSDRKQEMPKEVNGVVVAMITNLTSIGLTATAQEIASYFKGLI